MGVGAVAHIFGLPLPGPGSLLPSLQKTPVRPCPSSPSPVVRLLLLSKVVVLPVNHPDSSRSMQPISKPAPLEPSPAESCVVPTCRCFSELVVA